MSIFKKKVEPLVPWQTEIAYRFKCKITYNDGSNEYRSIYVNTSLLGAIELKDIRKQIRDTDDRIVKVLIKDFSVDLITTNNTIIYERKELHESMDE